MIRDAYDKLREARYPLTLPFDLWIETVRQFCNYFETPLARVLDVFRPSDDLFAPAQAVRPRQHLHGVVRALTGRSGPLHRRRSAVKWHELYGYDSPAEATTHATDPGPSAH